MSDRSRVIEFAIELAILKKLSSTHLALGLGPELVVCGLFSQY